MITITQHKNFTNWFQVYSFGKMVDEFNQRARAIRFARVIAQNSKATHINIMGKATRVR